MANRILVLSLVALTLDIASSDFTELDKVLITSKIQAVDNSNYSIVSWVPPNPEVSRLEYCSSNAINNIVSSQCSVRIHNTEDAIKIWHIHVAGQNTSSLCTNFSDSFRLESRNGKLPWH